MELLNTVSMQDAKRLVRSYFEDWTTEVEEIHILQAIDRILAEDIVAKINIPEFNRSTVDGYAVMAKDTVGASEGIPSFFNIIGEIYMGEPTHLIIKSGESCYVPTGGMLPYGSDGVVMVEYTELLDDNTICIHKTIAPLENTLQVGEDIKAGETIFNKGHIIRSQDIGVLAGVGVATIKVFKKLRIGIISTGDEIISPEDQLSPGKVRDMNTYSLAAAIVKDGCLVSEMVVVKDDLNALKEKITQLLDISDVILISGGSSMGNRDVTKEAINQLGEPGAFLHGIAVKPGKPTIAGRVRNKGIFGLPGQPVSALVIYHVLVRDFISYLLKFEKHKPYIMGEMAVNVPSAPGKEHYVMVTISQENDKTICQPIYGKSGMLTMMTRSSGYIIIDQNKEGIYKGELVKVFLF